ncbi:MAG: hypothetical protein WBX25_25750 [Rhodomicrobium sp.]
MAKGQLNEMAAQVSLKAFSALDMIGRLASGMKTAARASFHGC